MEGFASVNRPHRLRLCGRRAGNRRDRGSLLSQRGADSPAIHNHKLTAADYNHIIAILDNLSL